MILNIAIAVMAVILGFSLSMFFLSRKGSEKKVIKNRMAYFAGVDVSLQNASRKHGHRRDGVKPLVERLRLFIQVVGAKISRFQKDNSLDMKMQQAAWPFLGSEFQVIMLGVGAVAALVLGLLTLDVLMAALGFIGGILGCMIALSIRIQRRQAAFVNQLGDMLSMVANALRAGFSFMQAMEHVAGEMNDPVRLEINKVVRDVNVGISLEEALNNMTKRIQSPDFNLVVAAVLIQRQVGGNLAQILDNISETISGRIRMRREVMALTAQGRMSGVILVVLPFALAAILKSINPGYLDPLFSEPVGRMAVGGSLVMILIGCVVIKKIVDIDI